MEQNTWFDPFYIESQLTEEERRIQKNVRDFCNKELRQNVVEKNTAVCVSRLSIWW